MRPPCSVRHMHVSPVVNHVAGPFLIMEYTRKIHAPPLLHETYAVPPSVSHVVGPFLIMEYIYIYI